MVERVLICALPELFVLLLIILSAILGSLIDTLQPIISSVTSASEVWTRLSTSCAAASRGRVVWLKARLAKNPKGSRSITAYMLEMRAIADNLALAQNPVVEEDLVVHIFKQLGDEYNAIVAALTVRTDPITYEELHDVLSGYERLLKENEAVVQVHVDSCRPFRLNVERWWFGGQFAH